MPLLIAILVVVVDRISKIYVESNFFEGQSIALIKDYLNLTYIHNPGAAFGILANETWLFIAVAALIVFLIAFFYESIKREGAVFRYGIAALVGGAIGNLIDRIISGAVTDFIQFPIWPIFNVADIAICVGAFLIVLSVLLDSYESSRYKMGRVIRHD